MRARGGGVEGVGMHIAGKVELATVDESGMYEKLLGNVYGHLKSHPPNLSLVCPT